MVRQAISLRLSAVELNPVPTLVEDAEGSNAVLPSAFMRCSAV
jgi:hypothetical protein